MLPPHTHIHTHTSNSHRTMTLKLYPSTVLLSLSTLWPLLIRNFWTYESLSRSQRSCGLERNVFGRSNNVNVDLNPSGDMDARVRFFLCLCCPDLRPRSLTSAHNSNLTHTNANIHVGFESTTSSVRSGEENTRLRPKIWHQYCYYIIPTAFLLCRLSH